MSADLFAQYSEAIRQRDLSLAKPSIHPTAIIEPGAQLGQRVNVGPFSWIGSEVVLADDVWIDSHVRIEGKTTVGTKSRVWSFATLGVLPQDLKYQGEPGRLVLGESNMIREYCNFSIGTEGGGAVTTIGNHNLFMVHTHIGHDTQVGSHCIFANGVSLAGHVKVHDHALMMGHCAVHQFCTVGRFALCAGGAMVTQDVAPFVMVHGNRAQEAGLNLVGLKRAGFTQEQLGYVKFMHKTLFRDGKTLEDAVSEIRAQVPSSEWRDYFLDFITSSERGICR